MTDEKHQESRGPRLCDVPDCGRRVYARGLCQSHHRQSFTAGPFKPIRPYHKHEHATARYVGLRLSPRCIEKLKRRAEAKGLSPSAAIAEALEEWSSER